MIQCMPRNPGMTHARGRHADERRNLSLGGCGMELEITADCGCENPEHVMLECCGAAMTRV